MSSRRGHGLGVLSGLTQLRAKPGQLVRTSIGGRGCAGAIAWVGELKLMDQAEAVKLGVMRSEVAAASDGDEGALEAGGHRTVGFGIEPVA